MKRAALYIRVSTQEQAQEGYSIGEQRERLIAYCKAHDWAIADIYVDGGYSGSNLKRPAIQKLMTETAKFDVVLVYKLDRLSRSQRDTLYLIEEIFLPNTVDFVSMQESFDTSSPFGKAMIGLLAVFAQLEREWPPVSSSPMPMTTHPDRDSSYLRSTRVPYCWPGSSGFCWSPPRSLQPCQHASVNRPEKGV